MGIKKLGDMNFILYDEMTFTIDFNFKITQEIIHARVMSMNLHALPSTATGPKFTTLGITP